jgi:hypothetical protein
MDRELSSRTAEILASRPPINVLRMLALIEDMIAAPPPQRAGSKSKLRRAMRTRHRESPDRIFATVIGLRAAAGLITSRISRLCRRLGQVAP